MPKKDPNRAAFSPGDGATTRPAEVPQWVASMGVPIWVTDPKGAIRYLNPRAEALFGCKQGTWVGQSCHSKIAGRTRSQAVCCPRCRVRVQAETGREIEPVRMRIPCAEEYGEVIVVVIAVESPQGRLLVHCIVDDLRERRLQRFLEGVASRTAPGEDVLNEPDTPRGTRGQSPAKTADTRDLTPREREILSMLAEDLSLHAIADRLVISYATVRNHVQHILAKLGVHTTLEAVAVWVLEDSA